MLEILEGNRTGTVEKFERRRERALWLAREVLPHEAGVRAWLSRARVSREDIDDIIQECYCRFAAKDVVDHISRPDAYFFTTARNIFVKKIKEARVVTFASISELGAMPDNESPSPEQETQIILISAKVRRMIEELPERRRRILILRKFEHLSQREIAQRVGETEAVVENELYEGVRALARAWRDEEVDAGQRLERLGTGETRRR